jgi:hypothetical protein
VHCSRTDRIRRRQRGLATLEFVLALPVILFMMLLTYNVLLLSQTRLDAINNARLHAMLTAYGLDSILTLLTTLQTTASGLPILSTTDADMLSPEGDLLTVIDDGGGDPTQRAQILNSQPTGVQKTTSHAALFGTTYVPIWNLDISDNYAIVAAPAWERADFPIGYDQYLAGDDLVFDPPVFGSLMPRAFPNAQ